MHCLKSLVIFSCLFCLLINSSLQAKHPCSKSARADYVIVGVGTAGAVLAKRLTDDKKTSVIALHIGENLTEDPLIKFSVNAGITVLDALIGPPFYKNGLTIPQPNADNRQLLWVLATPEGGASSINAGAYCRGTNQVYAQWEAIAGPKWSVDRVLGIYKKLETYNGETPNPAARGYHGPIDVRQVQDPIPVAIKFTEATIAATDFPFVFDYNDPQTPIGVSAQFQYTQNGPDGEFRVSSVNAFLNEKVVTLNGRGINGRKLRILFNSTGLRTMWKGNKAVGVEYLQNGKMKQVFAKKGVIVCCGLKSSFFLLHSGVGPRSLLESFNIPVVFDNPNVGQGLADQPSLRMIFTSNPDDTPLFPTNGLFAQISWLPAPIPGSDQTIRELRLATASPIPGFTLSILDLCQPRSRGSISINSADPLADPIINLGTLTQPEDLTILQAGLQVYMKDINEAFKLIDPSYELIFPDPAILDNSALVQDFIKENIGCNQHFQSHCRMAPQAQGGVVDSTGHVYGVQNLIVADGSVVPLCMDGSPMASAYLIAANIAEELIHQKKEKSNCHHHSPCSNSR
jgi:choline dehydrogenase-like flavoprotein